MQGEVGKTRFRLGIVAFIALCGLFALMVATPASAVHTKNPAQTSRDEVQAEGLEGFHNDDFNFAEGDEYYGWDPMETSVPYLAWRGEEVRLVKCISEDRAEAPPDPIQEGFGGIDGEFQILDWSGDAHVWPKFFDDVDQKTESFEGRGDQDNRDCWAIDITSHKAGIAIVKLKVEDSDEEDLRGDGDPGFVHQFTVIWMNLDRAILRNLEGGEGPAGGPISEPLGRDVSNRLGVLVKGSVPLNEEFRSEIGLDPAQLRADNTIVLPDAYPFLARTTLAHTSLRLALANDGQEGNDDAENPTCDDDPVTGAGTDTVGAPTNDADNDDGDPFAADLDACDTDRADANYVREPRHAPGDFWDIHDSTGPFNSGVYATAPTTGLGAAQPVTVTDFCPGEEADTDDATPKPDDACHVINFQDTNCSDADDNLRPNDTGHINDTVDNCDEGEWDAFSRVFHDVSGEQGVDAIDNDDEPTIGPYSPTRPDETLLSDSLLNINDAPMPATIVFPLNVDTADPRDAIGSFGVGADSVDKHDVYNRANDGQDECVDDESPSVGDGPENEHCVTAPFSGAYIPPSPTMESESADNVPDRGGFLDDDQDTASGIHGSFANNFYGYFPVCYPQGRVWEESGRNNCDGPANGVQNDGLYHYWDTVDVLQETFPQNTNCVRFDPTPLGSGGEIFWQTPGGPQEIALYTDEHGEAQFNFQPGEGIPAALIPPNQSPTAICDLDAIEGEIGTANIQVNARYPFQPVTHAGVTSNTVVKRIQFEFKSLRCQPKPADQTTPRAGENVPGIDVCFARVAVPLEGFPETVCFNDDPDGRILGIYTGRKLHDSEVLDFSGTRIVADPRGGGRLCIETNEDGLAAIEVDHGTGETLIVAVFENERNLTRCAVANAGAPDRADIPARCRTTGALGVQGAALPPIVAQLIPPLPAPPAGTGPTFTGQQSTGGNPTGNQLNLPTLGNGGKQPTVNGTKAVAKNRATLVFVRIVKPLKQGAVRMLLIRVKSPNKVARIHLKLIGPRGKVLGTVIRTVKTNRTVRVPNLRVPKAVTNVRAKLVA
jgi:hypothetical protein